jgi:hypothetical protein
MAYVYGLSNGNWSEQATLVGDSGKFGRAVALDDNMALVGSPTDVIGPAISRAFLFTRNGSQWTQETSLTNNDTQPFAHFGYTVALQNETAFIGASQQEVEPLAGIYGAVYIFQKQSVTSNRPPLIQARPLSDTRANGANGQVPLAVVSDPDQVAASLRVAVSPAALNGVAISDLEIDNAGVVRGNILAGCNATLSPPNLAFTLTVTDATNVSTSAPLLLNVRPNAPPALAYAPSNFVAFNEGGGSLPIYNASDDGQINSAILQSVTPAFAGQISVGLLARNPGSASIENARPSGNYTAIIRLTDNCGLTTDVPLNFTVGPAATPTVPRRTHTP